MTLTPPKVTHAHDKAFRNAMSDLRVARDFLEHYLPVVVLNKVNLQTLVLSKESYVDEELKLLITDVLYSVSLKSKSSSSAYIYILCEHLSTPDRLAPWRMVRYISRIVDQHLKSTNQSHLPLIIPLVIYNGRSVYPYSTRLYDLFEEDEQALAQEYMFQGFELIDFNEITDEEIRGHQWSCMMEILLKHAFSRDIMAHLSGFIHEVRSLAARQADSYLLGMLKYVIECTNIPDRKQFREFLQQSLTPSLEERAMTTLAQQWLEEGFEKGVQQGMQQGMQQGGYSLLLRQLEHKFKTVPESYRLFLTQADAQTLLRLGERILEARSLAKVFEVAD